MIRNNFKPIDVSVNDMDIFEKERTSKEQNIYKKTLGMIDTIG